MDVVIYGADTETYYGKPMTLQFYSEQADCNDIIFVDEDTATSEFLAWCDTLKRKCLHVVYVHNLDFDLPEFLWSVKERLVEVTGGEFKFDVGDWRISGVYGKPTFCRLSNDKRKVQIIIVDSFSWYQGSLAQAAELFCPGLPKLKQPKGLGTKLFSVNDDDFVEYAMRDAEVAFHIGVAVQRIHREFDIRQSVSLADMAAKIFRRHFLHYTIPQPNRDVILAALNSYHGGKNNVVPNAAPAWHMNVSAMDISSAYPYAMYTLPAFSNKRLYKRLGKTKRVPNELPPYGVYQITGNTVSCNWPSLFSHTFKPINGEAFSNLWVQGMELNEAIRSDEVKIKHIRGFYYEHERDNQTPALRAFVEYFYRLKSEATEKVQRHMYKIILNAVYGKFIQTRKNSRVIYTDVDADETTETHELIAGGMFHPFIASAITAHTRAYMHQIEHAHEAIHTATDGIYTKLKRPKKVPLAPKTKGLGSLEIEGHGDLLLIRNKCYILYSDDGKMPSQHFKGKRIAKYAKHGFQGSVYDLERLVAQNRRKYTATRPNRLREALKRGLNVNEFVERPYVLKVGPIKTVN